MLRIDLKEHAEEDINWQAAHYALIESTTLSDRYVDAVHATLRELAVQPGMGTRCAYTEPALHDLRQWRVGDGFDVMQIFYRVENDALVVARIVSGQRDLPRRLLEPPDAD